MAITTKLNLSNAKFYQPNGDNLALSGSTSFGTIQYITDQSSLYTARSLTDAAFVTGLTSGLQSQINYVSGVTDTNTTNIATNTAAISYLSGVTDQNISDIADNATDISTVSGLTVVNAAGISYISGVTDTNTTNIATNTAGISYISGVTDNNTTNIATNVAAISYLSGVTDQNISDIADNTADIIELSAATFNSITGATNGLTKDGREIKLGGALTGDTSITGPHDLNLGSFPSGFINGLNVWASGCTLVSYFGGLGQPSGGFSSDANGTQIYYNDASGNETSISFGPAAGGGTGISITNQDDSAGIRYAADYSSGYVARSLVDAAYVTGLTSTLQTDISGKLDITDFNAYSATTDTRLDTIEGDIVTLSAATITSITGATNGLTKTGRDVVWGGTLTGATTISTGNAKIAYESTGVNSYHEYTLSDTYTTTFFNMYSGHETNNNYWNIYGGSGCLELRHGVDSTNFTSILVKDAQIELNSCIVGSSKNVCLGGNALVYSGDYSGDYVARSIPDVAFVTGQTGAIQANNGLTRAGSYISLGGVLTGDTTIGCASHAHCLIIDAPFCANDIHVLTFDTATVTGHSEGRLYYSNCALNFEREISGVTLQVGEEQVVRVTNTTGSLIANGSAVVITGAAGGLPTIAKTIATNNASRYTIGLVTSDVADNNEGYVTTQGAVRGINTSAWVVGDIVYVSPTTAGAITNVKPTYPQNIVQVGIVTVDDAVNGEILVRAFWEEDHVDKATFTGYTASTQTLIDGKLDTTDFNSYTATTDGRITVVENVSNIAVTGVTNGLTKTDAHNVRLGGALTQATSLTGAFSFTVSPTEALVLRTLSDNSINIDAQSGGAVALKSQSGTVTNQTSFTNAVGIFADFDAASGFAIYDNRAGANKTGIVYAADYSPNYVNRSLVDKAYVDSVATGLQAKAAVFVATTTNIDLTGGTFTSGSTIDSVVVYDGARILVKDQTGATENGIWVYSAATSNFYRAEDFDGTPAGEVNNGDLIPVISGNTHQSTQWILTTPDPIDIGVDELSFSLFSQLLQIGAGNGIDITNISGVQTISVELSPTNPGLTFDGTGLELDYTIFSSGLSTSGGQVYANASTDPITGTEIPVKFGTADALFIDSDDFSFTTASNGLTKVDSNVTLGGALTGNTTVNGAAGSYDLCFTQMDVFALGFNTGTITDIGPNPAGLEYAADYSNDFTCRSLVDAQWVNDQITGSTLTFNNGLTKQDDVISWGGSLTGNTFVSLGTGRICMTDGGTSTVSLVSDCSSINVVNTCVRVQSCTNGSCLGSVVMTNDGHMTLYSNNASSGFTITDAGAGLGLTYSDDYSGTFVDRSLVDKAYVDASAGSLTANNGIVRLGNTVSLGGSLTGNTAIDISAYAFELTSTGITANFDTDADNIEMYVGGGAGFSIDGPSDNISVSTNAGIQFVMAGSDHLTLSRAATNISLINDQVELTGPVTLESTPSTGSATTDAVLVWNSTDKLIKQVSASNLGEDNNRYSVTGVSNSTVNLTGNEYVVLVDASLGVVTVNLPAAPATGTAFKIKDKGNALTNNITISGNGNNIDGSANATINTDYGALELVYDGTEWFSLAFIN